MSDIILHQWEISPFCTKIRLSLKAKSLSPVGKLPVLEIKGELIQDSRTIIDKIEALYPEPALLPSDPELRADAELMQDWADESIYFYEISLRALYPEALEKLAGFMTEGRPGYEKVLLKPVLKKELSKAAKSQGVGRRSKTDIEQRFLFLMKQIDLKLADKTWLVGDAKSIADFALAGQLYEILRTSHVNDQLLALPNLKAWLGRMQCL